MNVELEIGVYDEKANAPQTYEKHKFDTIDDAIGLVNFLKLSYNAIQNEKALLVRLDDKSKVFLLDYESKSPVKELYSDLKQKYNTIIPEESQINYTSTLTKNSNFDFKEDDSVQYAQTTLGKELPFKLFSPDKEQEFFNLLTDTKELSNGDFALMERQFTESNNLQFFGTEKITDLNDVAFLFKSLEDEAVEHAFLLYDFKDKGYFVQHISTGTFTAAMVDPKTFLGNVMETKPSSITLIHNHPSGNLLVSTEDRKILQKIKETLEHTDIEVNDGIIINLRSGNYVQFNETDGFRKDLKTPTEGLQKIPTYSFSKHVFVQDYHPSKISSSEDIAKFINTQKFGVSDKTELLLLNQQLQIMGKFVMPQKNEIDFILNKVLKFGGTTAVLYGNNITPELVNKYNSILKPSGVNIMDGIQFKSANSFKMYKSYADEGTLQMYEPDLKFDKSLVNEGAETIYNKSNKIPMENKVSWYDRNVTTRTTEYKNFVKKLDSTSPEQYYQDGERIFTEKEKKFQQIYNLKNNINLPVDLNNSPIQNITAPSKIEPSIVELAKKIEKRGEEEGYTSKLNNPEGLNILQQILDVNKIESKELKGAVKDYIFYEAPEYPQLADVADNSIDGGQSYYEDVLKKYERKAELFSERMNELEFIFKENNFDVESISDLKKEPQIVLSHLFDSVNKIEKETQKIDILQYQFILPDLGITNEQRREFSHSIEYGNSDTSWETKADPTLTKEQLNTIPDYIDGWYISAMNKQNLVYDKLSFDDDFISYEIIDNRIVKTELDKNLNDSIKILNKTDIQFTKENNLQMENTNITQTEYLKNQLKYMGFGEDSKLHNDLEAGINSQDKQFQIATNSDKVLPGNKADFTLNYNKSESGGIYLNSYDAALTNSKSETVTQKFPVKKDNYFTAKEAVNLMEGRAVKNDFFNSKTQKTETAFFKLNLDEPKNEFGNYDFQTFYKNYGIDTKAIVDKSNMIFDKSEYKDNVIASLEKGNVVKVKFELENKIIEGKAILNPQYKNLSLYDNDMTRLNTNKALEGIDNGQSKQKGNVREQGISRGL